MSPPSSVSLDVSQAPVGRPRTIGRARINSSEGTFGGHVIEFCDVFDTVRETGYHGSFNSWGRDRFWELKGAPPEELPKLALLDAEKTIIRNSRWRCDHGWDVDLEDGGIHLVTVPMNSPAAQVGLHAGDLIQRINAKPVKTVADLRQMTENRDGKPLKIRFVRDQQQMSLSITQ